MLDVLDCALEPSTRFVEGSLAFVLAAAVLMSSNGSNDLDR